MLLLTCVVSLLVSDAGVAQPPSLEHARAQSRLRASITAVVAGGYSVSSGGLGGGPGFGADVGSQLGDSVSVAARLTLGTTLAVATGLLGLAVDWTVTSDLTLGVGAALGVNGGALVRDLPSTSFVGLPLRAAYALSGRGPTQVDRQGLMAVVEFTPGVAFVQSSGFTLSPSLGVGAPLVFCGVVGVGYVWW